MALLDMPRKLSVVALFTRAWIEISLKSGLAKAAKVALFTRAWIEMMKLHNGVELARVALFTRAWIEITADKTKIDSFTSRPLHEVVD